MALIYLNEPDSMAPFVWQTISCLDSCTRVVCAPLWYRWSGLSKRSREGRWGIHFPFAIVDWRKSDWCGDGMDVDWYFIGLDAECEWWELRVRDWWFNCSLIGFNACIYCCNMQNTCWIKLRHGRVAASWFMGSRKIFYNNNVEKN